MITTELKNSIMELDVEDLWEANRMICELLKARRAVDGIMVKASLKVGDVVMISGGKKIKEEIVRDIKRTKAVVEINGVKWSVPLSIIHQKEKAGA